MRTFLLSIALFLGSSAAAQASETAILTYRIFRESVPVADLTELVTTGTASPGLAANLKLAKQEPQKLRSILSQPVKLNPGLADRVLQSDLGKPILDELSRTIRNPAGVADRVALRGALTLSIQDDGEFTLLEILQKYPTQEVLIDGDRLESTQRLLKNWSRQLDGLRTILGW